MDESDAAPPHIETPPPAPPVRTAAKTERAKRLASALRDNLRRRKLGTRPPQPAKPSN